MAIRLNLHGKTIYGANLKAMSHMISMTLYGAERRADQATP
jgi:hypothetical protein